MLRRGFVATAASSVVIAALAHCSSFGSDAPDAARDADVADTAPPPPDSIAPPVRDVEAPTPTFCERLGAGDGGLLFCADFDDPKGIEWARRNGQPEQAWHVIARDGGRIDAGPGTDGSTGLEAVNESALPANPDGGSTMGPHVEYTLPASNHVRLRLSLRTDVSGGRSVNPIDLHFGTFRFYMTFYKGLAAVAPSVSYAFQTDDASAGAVLRNGYPSLSNAFRRYLVDIDVAKRSMEISIDDELYADASFPSFVSEAAPTETTVLTGVSYSTGPVATANVDDVVVELLP